LWVSEKSARIAGGDFHVGHGDRCRRPRAASTPAPRLPRPGRPCRRPGPCSPAASTQWPARNESR
jgi:hypothetical protein